MSVDLFGTTWHVPRWLGGDDDPSPPVEEPTETVPVPPTEHDDAQTACPSNDSAASHAEAVNQCGPGSPFSSNYADSFSEAHYDPNTDSIYARYDEQGVTVRYPLSSVQSEPCSSGGDAYAMATGRDQNGIFVPGLLNAHTAPRLAKLAGEAREWKQAWENADAMTRASLELLPVVTAYGGHGMAKEPSSIESSLAWSRSHRVAPGVTAAPSQAAKALNIAQILSHPQALWGKSAAEIAEAFSQAGYPASVRTSTRGSGRAQVVEIQGHPTVTQIQVHPGGGRHQGAYVKISTSTEGIIKIVDETNYRAAPGERATVIPIAKELP